MQFVKTNLKNAKQALGSGNFEEAQYYAEAVLENDSKNYHALLFAGKACEELGDATASYRYYTEAIAEKPLDPLAWKGLLKLQERQKNVPLYLDSVVGLIQCYRETDSIHFANDVYHKAIRFVTANGDPESRKRLLELQLPGSPIFEFMEGKMPALPVTFGRLIAIVEREEREVINKKVSKNKARIGGIGAKKAAASSEPSKEEIVFKYNVYKNSKLPALYNGLINTTPDDDERRATESKMLRYLYNFLKVAPAAEKPQVAHDLYEMANGLVVIGAHEPLAWKLEIDWQDVAEFKDLDFTTIFNFAKDYPNDGLAKVINGYLHSDISQFTLTKEDRLALAGKEEKKQKEAELKEDEDEDEEDEVNEEEIKANISGIVEESESSSDWTPSVVLETISEGYEQETDFILAYRILAEYYLQSQEYEGAIDVARNGLDRINRLYKEFSRSYNNGIRHLKLVIASSYIYYQAPKNFDASLDLFDEILQETENNATALVGKALILIERRQLDEAGGMLENALAIHPNDLTTIQELAWCHILEGKHESGRAALIDSLNEITGMDPKSLDTKAKIWWRVGTSYWETRDNEPMLDALDSKDSDTPKPNVTKAFNSFVNSLHENGSFAPSYTSLGIVYSDAIGDKARASKCFYRAFELSSGEIDAAYRLATEFADNTEWELVEVVASRVVESDRVRTVNTSKLPSWPYRALGIAGLNHRDYAKAVRNFQASLRISPKDASSWVGLGEAYMNSGKYSAASKAMNKALQYEPENWIARYQLGIIMREVGEYDDAVAAFKAILVAHPKENSIKTALVETLLLSAQSNLVKEFYSVAVDNALNCVKVAAFAVNAGNNHTQDLWRCVAGACEVFLTVRSQIQRVPLDEIVELVKIGVEAANDDEITKQSVLSMSDMEDYKGDGLSKEEKCLVNYYITALRLSLAFCRADNTSRATGHYNLGIGLLKVYSIWEGDINKHLKSSTASLKRAIQLEHRNYEFWNAYGVASAPLNARVAQHCFIRSLVLNLRQPKTWSNLAALYMSQSDLELATEALNKAQAIDPEHVPAWIGHGLINSTLGNTRDAINSFQHSYLISKGGDGLAKFLYGLSIFEQASESHGKDNALRELESGVLALQKYLMLEPTSDLALTIQGLLLERESGFEYGISLISKYCDILEQKYEHSESYEVLVQFAKAKAHLARLCLGARQFDRAIEHAQFAIDVASDDESLQKCLLSCALTCGLASYFNKGFDESIDYFRQALQLSDEDQDVVILLTQVLWAQGGKEERDVALDQLYNSVGEKGTSLKITLLLGAIGLVDDSDLVEAAYDELRELGVEDLEKDKESRVQEIMSMITNSVAPWQKAAYMWPSNYTIWKNLDSRVALQLAKAGNSKVSSTELSSAYVTERSVEDCQRAVFLAPWNTQAWNGLASAI
ncbi:superkiller protein 3 [Trichomonascus vanleenenianus]|uniref:SKI complex subunit tetratricopeptide repeat protein SKI3 n=1 Tax=Trichomonascus vanleenenianus TaxID=2268995 RepID=UPI003ECA3A19